ncbi:glycosyltransferase family 4 protein [Mycolicibacterium sp. 018/SC-01/001]|uniref:glycosyltransferase n=1 Tax=Mycolicibacterium sp. 018/SC-01/001 TaxID=2592069 RepID=UPI001180B558|nr:glycosyltransferase [Mycolicibacterium sp. 018/SC-01/001]TRW80498.1 glycosyltransferase family 4 protein [Mycolicibacterium sp. 018/SC-01/001]
MAQTSVAIAHDYLTQRGGAERVVLAMARAFPGAPIYTTLYDPDGTFSEFKDLDIRTSWLNRFKVFRRWHRLAFPLLTLAVGSMWIDADTTFVSSSGWAHGIPVSGTKIVYCYSPARWLYQSRKYLGNNRLGTKKIALFALAPILKRWDKKKALSADKYFAISTEVKERIQRVYAINAEVLPAPHSFDTEASMDAVDLTSITKDGCDFHLCISRLLPYKNVDAVIEAFNVLESPLVVVGGGPEERRLAALAGPSVLMLKDLSDSQIRWLYAHCTAVVSASYEDYGLTPLEAATYGKPAIVLRWGGFLDTVTEKETGIYFDEPRPDLIREAVLLAREMDWDVGAIRKSADRFTERYFAARLMENCSVRH